MTRHHRRITTALALTLALAASSAPVALGDPPPLAQAESAIANTSASGWSCGDVCSGHGYGYEGVALSTADPASCGDACSGHGYAPVNTPATVVRVVAPSGSFDWGDAAIGAGAAVVLVGIGLAGTRTALSARGRLVHQQRGSASR
jgi:hypothetical protein